MRWKEEEISQAVYLLKEGKKYFEIGEVLGRTEKSVKEKLNNIGFKREDYITFNTYNEVRVCESCQKSFNTLKTKDQKFCSHSCSAKTNNVLRTKSKHDCLNCGSEVKRNSSIFCQIKCMHEYKFNDEFNQFINGKDDFNHQRCKQFMLKLYEAKCMNCSWCEINKTTNKVPIELEHIDGNSENNSLTNLKLLCPNCHSLTPTYKALNKGNGRTNRYNKRG